MLDITEEVRGAKKQKIADDQGYQSYEEMLKHMGTAVAEVGICLNPGCDFTTDCEPMAEDSWCEVCETNSVCSALSL